MEDLTKKANTGLGDKEIVYSRAIKAGKRIYYLDVKKNLKDDLFIAITESKRSQAKEGQPVTFEKHKVFLYKEDFDKFMDGMNDIIRFIKEKNVMTPITTMPDVDPIAEIIDEDMLPDYDSQTTSKEASEPQNG